MPYKDNGVCFSCDNFSNQLKKLRTRSKLSQHDLSIYLSKSHKLFENITQPMISNWEKGNNLPSLTRRVGVATYFNIDYSYSNSELNLLKRSSKNEMFYDPHLTIYPLKVNKTEDLDWEVLDEATKVQIRHAFFVRHKDKLDDFLERKGLRHAKVKCYYHDNMLVGHVMYSLIDGVFYYICAAGMNSDIHSSVLAELESLCDVQIIEMHATIPAIKYLLLSIYGVVVSQTESAVTYRFNKGDFFSNPYIKALFLKKQDFILLSYQSMLDNSSEFGNGINKDTMTTDHILG
ncbi:helix-turn-helix domain-containing protein [Photobacterium rosenbergii]|uniref:helix-turn-helix domain-containing protein n=1 Tax=Photobacterium rosenbergii TaxID=294936 RepID=UPI001C9905CD|nr:helix-turn-helix transcriptional regulator [Photobacterium rosenbergii]MBY5944430.1 helix-turn-helix domain-containing protein [Photobacterium rosenbergii]